MSLTAHLKSRFTTLLETKLTERSKRMIVLASLFAKTYSGDNKKIDIEIARKLNELLHLSNADGGIMLPIQLSRFIWKDGVSTIELNGADLDIKIREAAQQITSQVPQWLRYCDTDGMCHDIEEVLRCQRQFTH